jgi:nucleotide-sensitive chloride channel 1A
MPDSGTSGFQIEYPAITLHAISRGEPGPSIYCQLDETAGNASDLAGASNETDEGDEGDVQMRELTILPQQAESRMFNNNFVLSSLIPFSLVETIFEALSQCASLHPDPEEEDEGGDAFLDESVFETFNGCEDRELSEVGRVRSNLTNENRYVPY